MQAIGKSLETARQKQQKKIEIQQKAEKLIKEGFAGSMSEFQNWLYLPKLFDRYHTELATALENTEFDTWINENFSAEIVKFQEKIMEWVNKASEFFPINHPGEIEIAFPEPPQVLLPAPPVSVQKSKSGLPLAIATGLGWLFGGWVLAGGATYILTKSNNSEKSTLSSDAYQALLIQGYKDAAKDYLTRFGDQTFASLRDYEAKAEHMIMIQTPKASNDVIAA